MSAESFIEYNEDSIIAAVEKMEGNLRSYGYVGEYVQAIQETYATYPEGDVELLRMVRAAQFVTNRKAGDTGEEVQAVYHGELLGLKLINSLEPGDDTDFKTGYAHSFIKFHLDNDRPEPSEGPETAHKHRLRLAELSEAIQEDLMCPIYAYGLNSIYEEFGEKATSKLSDEVEHQRLAMMGFRMIVTEALKPVLIDDTDELLAEFPAPVKGIKISLQTIAEIERTFAQNRGIPDELIDSLEAVNSIDWQDISYIRKTLCKKYIELDFSQDKFRRANVATVAQVDRHIETMLMKFVKESNLIDADDLLSIQGDYYAIGADKNVPLVFDPTTEIRGKLDGIRIVEVPSSRYLLRHLGEDPEESELEAEDIICAIALRIVNPTFINDPAQSEHDVERTEGETIDIPLIYKTITFKRLKAEALEPEA